MIKTQGQLAPLSAEDRKLIRELRGLTRALDRSGHLAKLTGKAALLPADVLERSPAVRTACLAAARDRCRQRVRSLELARVRRRIVSFVLPFALGATGTLAVAIAGKPYVLQLLN